MTKIAILFDRFGPYHIARLEKAAEVFTTTGIEIFGESKEYEWDRVETGDGFRRMTLFPGLGVQDVSRRQIIRATNEALNHLSPDAVVIPGWTHLAAITALSWCCKHKIPRIVLSESTAWDEQRSVYKEWVKRNIVMLFTTGLVGGDPHQQYLASLGMHKSRIFLGYNIVDNDYFRQGAALARKKEKNNRECTHLPINYFLASARFVAKKNLFRLLEAYGAYLDIAKELLLERTQPSSYGDKQIWDLVLLGDGNLRNQLTALLSELGIQGHVHMPGFKQYNELPIYYGLAKAFIHTSTTEQWGLVVNEAMAAGLPVLVSRTCGCAENLVSEGVNGFTFDPKNTDEISDRMFAITQMKESRRLQMGRKSMEIIAGWSPDRFSQGLKGAVQKAMESDSQSSTLFDRLLLWAMSYR